MTLPALEHETAANPTHSIIWLHGLGANGREIGRASCRERV